MKPLPRLFLAAAICLAGLTPSGSTAADDWLQLQGNAGRSGNAPGLSLADSIGLINAIPLSDAIFTSPVVGLGKVFTVDGSGEVLALDQQTLEVAWRFTTRGGTGNCNNVASPALVGKYLHLGTMAGYYYVLDAKSGTLVKELDWGEPIFSAPAVGNGRKSAASYLALLSFSLLFMWSIERGDVAISL